MIMLSYRQVKEWHSSSDLQTLTDRVADSADLAFDRSYIKTKLENGLLRVWRVCFRNLLLFVLCV